MKSKRTVPLIADPPWSLPISCSCGKSDGAFLSDARRKERSHGDPLTIILLRPRLVAQARRTNIRFALIERRDIALAQCAGGTIRISCFVRYSKLRVRDIMPWRAFPFFVPATGRFGSLTFIRPPVEIRWPRAFCPRRCSSPQKENPARSGPARAELSVAGLFMKISAAPKRGRETSGCSDYS